MTLTTSHLLSSMHSWPCICLYCAHSQAERQGLKLLVPKGSKVKVAFAASRYNCAHHKPDRVTLGHCAGLQRARERSEVCQVWHGTDALFPLR